MKKLLLVSACLLSVTNLSYANLVQRHIYNKTQSTNWHITFEGGSNNWVNIWNNPSPPYMCTNINSDPITDDPGCQVAARSDILQQGCGAKVGGICADYQSNAADAINGVVHVTDPCGHTSYMSYWTTVVGEIVIDNEGGNQEQIGGATINDPTKGDITIYSDKCM